MRCELSIPISADFIAKAVNGEAKIGDTLIKSITTDTRELRPCDLYVPIKGEYFDGNDFCELAGVKGATVLSTNKSIADIYVKDTKDALLLIAKAYKTIFPNLKTVAITGSVGKTTTKDICAALLREKYKTHATKKNYNNDVGVPFTVLSAPHDCEVLVIEMGMNHRGEIARLSDCINPNISVITKIGNAHIGNLGSRRAIANEKLSILNGNKESLCIIPYGEPLLSGNFPKKTASSVYKSADCYLEVNRRDTEGFYFDYRSDNIKIIDGYVKSTASHIPECVTMAIAASEELMESSEKIISSLSGIRFPSKMFKIGNVNFIDDSYNSSPESVMAALKTLRSYPHPRGLLLGDMLELGARASSLHKEIGNAVASAGIDRLYAYGEHCEDIALGALLGGMDKSKIFKNKDILRPQVTAKQIADNQVSGYVLFKASHKVNLNNILDILKIITK